MALQIQDYMNRLSQLCDVFCVNRLAIFGSASRDDFEPASSDVDFLVDFGGTYPLGAFEQYFGLKEALERLFRRPVDLVEERAIQNPYFGQAIAQDRIWVYEAGNQETDL